MTGSTNAVSDNDTKSTLIITVDAGSTVGAYTDAACTTLVKTATERSEGEFWITGLDNGLYYIKATKNTDESIVSYTINEFGVYRINIPYRKVPEFTYSGSYELVHDDDTSIDTTSDSDLQSPWKIRFLTSGTLRFTNMYGSVNGIDVFLVGAGGGGGGASSGAGSGGGGGYTATHRAVSVATNTDYLISIGNGGTLRTDGGSSSGFGYTANGGSHGSQGGVAGGAGGSGGGAGGSIGGAGGSDGSNGSNGGSSGTIAGGTGQGTTTREFGGYTNTVSSVPSSTTLVLVTTPTTVEQAFLVSGKYLTIGDRSGSTGNTGVYPISSFDASTNTVTLSTTITATVGDVVRFGNLYSGGGGGAVGGAGGAGGGATAGSSAAVQGNTGGGGAGGASSVTTAQAGASGIVIIRNAR